MARPSRGCACRSGRAGRPGGNRAQRRRNSRAGSGTGPRTRRLAAPGAPAQVVEGELETARQVASRVGPTRLRQRLGTRQVPEGRDGQPGRDQDENDSRGPGDGAWTMRRGSIWIAGPCRSRREAATGRKGQRFHRCILPDPRPGVNSCHDRCCSARPRGHESGPAPGRHEDKRNRMRANARQDWRDRPGRRPAALPRQGERSPPGHRRADRRGGCDRRPPGPGRYQPRLRHRLGRGAHRPPRGDPPEVVRHARRPAPRPLPLGGVRRRRAADLLAVRPRGARRPPGFLRPAGAGRLVPDSRTCYLP